MEMVSVVIPVFNGEETIRRAIDSALGQSWKGLEVIVVDDGSTDRTSEVLGEYRDKIRAIHQQNRGVAVARNVGIDQARGDLVAFLDADDEWLPEKLETQLGVLRAMPDVGVLGGGTEWRKGNERRLRTPVPGEVSLDQLLWGNPLSTSTVVVRAAVLRESGLRFWEELLGPEDWHLWMRLAGRTRLWNDKRVVSRHYLTAEGISRRDPANLLVRYAKMYHRLFENLLDDPAVAPTVRRHWDDININIELLRFRILVDTHPWQAMVDWCRVVRRLRGARQLRHSVRTLVAGLYHSIFSQGGW
jgi:glycosyltransferase involved in cell wall biosynthesis